MAALLWIVGFMLYGAGAVAVGMGLYFKLVARNVFDPGLPATFAAAVWPFLGLWILLGLVAIGRVERQRALRAERDREQQRLLKLGMDELRKEGLA